MIPRPSAKTATKTNRHAGIAWLLLAAGLLGVSRTHAQNDNDVFVLTALPATYSVTHALAEGTAIAVENLPERGRRMSALPNLLNQSADRYADTLSRAEAVVTIGKLWREDPLFIAARRFNIRVVDIDATKPWSTTLEGISVALEPRQSAPWAENETGTREPSVHFWLSPANGARMAEIIAADLVRLSPEDQAAIEANLAALRRELLGLKVEFELKFAELADVTLFALASEFVYLTSDMGLYVDAWFVKQDIDWTESDLAAFGAYLRDNDIGVVVHKWEPEERIRGAIEANGARLAVLDTLEAGIVEDGRLMPRSYLELMRNNLEALHATLEAHNSGQED